MNSPAIPTLFCLGNAPFSVRSDLNSVVSVGSSRGVVTNVRALTQLVTANLTTITIIVLTIPPWCGLT